MVSVTFHISPVSGLSRSAHFLSFTRTRYLFTPTGTYTSGPWGSCTLTFGSVLMFRFLSIQKSGCGDGRYAVLFLADVGVVGVAVLGVWGVRLGVVFHTSTAARRAAEVGVTGGSSARRCSGVVVGCFCCRLTAGVLLPRAGFLANAAMTITPFFSLTGPLVAGRGGSGFGDISLLQRGFADNSASGGLRAGVTSFGRVGTWHGITAHVVVLCSTCMGVETYVGVLLVDTPGSYSDSEPSPHFLQQVFHRDQSACALPRTDRLPGIVYTSASSCLYSFRSRTCMCRTIFPDFALRLYMTGDTFRCIVYGPVYVLSSLTL